MVSERPTAKFQHLREYDLRECHRYVPLLPIHRDEHYLLNIPEYCKSACIERGRIWILIQPCIQRGTADVCRCARVESCDGWTGVLDVRPGNVIHQGKWATLDDAAHPSPAWSLDRLFPSGQRTLFLASSPVLAAESCLDSVFGTCTRRDT